MKYRPLGPSGIEASVVAVGAWAMGGWMWGGQEETDSIRSIHAAFDAGINFIDTAPMYGFGRSEQIVGKAVAGRREQFVIATKCGLRWDLEESRGEPHFFTTEDAIDPNGPIEVRRYNGPESIRREVEQSLKRLDTDYIDLLQTHWQECTTRTEDTAAAMLKLKDEGKVRAIGACNATPQHLEAYGRTGPIDTDQEKYSMLHREAEQSQLPYCRQHGLAFLAYSPLALGLLTGKIGPDRTFPPGDLRGVRPMFSMENRQVVGQTLDKIRPVAQVHGITLAQLAIAWTIAQPGVTHALVGARTPQQAAENSAAADVVLSDAELAAITAATAHVRLRV
jgi:methylglyoxal reductase